MLKKISLVAIAVVGTSLVSTLPAAADTTDCDPTFGPCEPPTDIPTPPAVLAALGMGLASLRKKNKAQQSDAE